MDTVFPVETSQRPDPHSDESQPMDLTRFPPEVRDFVRAAARLRVRTPKHAVDSADAIRHDRDRDACPAG